MLGLVFKGFRDPAGGVLFTPPSPKTGYPPSERDSFRGFANKNRAKSRTTWKTTMDWETAPTSIKDYNFAFDVTRCGVPCFKTQSIVRNLADRRIC